MTNQGNRTTYPLMKARHAQALGYMTAHWTALDITLHTFISILMGLHGDASFVPAIDLSSMQRFAMIRAFLWEVREQEWIDEWDDIKPRFEALRALRNDAVHGSWNNTDSTYEVFRVSARERVSKRFIPFSTERLNKLTEDIIALYIEIDEFTFRVWRPARQALTAGSQKPPLIPGHGRSSTAQGQSREAKRLRKQASREHPKNRPKASGPT